MAQISKLHLQCIYNFFINKDIYNIYKSAGEFERLAEPIARWATREPQSQHQSGSLPEDIVFVAMPLLLRHHQHIAVNGPRLC